MMNKTETQKEEAPFYYDSFVGLLSYLEFQEEIKKILAAHKRRKLSFAILHLKFEFSKVNNSFLQEITRKLFKCLRKTDVISRLKENEFLVIILDITKHEDAAIIANKILQEFKNSFILDGQEIVTSLSIGISLYPDDGEELNILQKNADIAMHIAKEEGSNKYHYCASNLSKKIQERTSAENNLKQALLNNELRLFYQPRVEIKTGEIVGVEALLRWKNAKGDMVYPDEFIPLAEETGEIVPITEWVLKTACRQTKMWHGSGLPRLSVSVNFTARILKEKNFFTTLESFLNSTGLNPKYLGLEISERFLLEDIGHSIKFLKQLKNLGVLIGIDNVGTSRSSLSYLKLFSADYLNIDKIFIRNIITDQNDAMIINDIITMAHNLNIKVVGEGIETRDQFLFLKQVGCDLYQGYYLSKPIPPEQLGDFLKTHRNAK